MDRLINIKVIRVSESRYRGYADGLGDLGVEGASVWETLTAARKAARKLLTATEECSG